MVDRHGLVRPGVHFLESLAACLVRPDIRRWRSQSSSLATPAVLQLLVVQGFKLWLGNTAPAPALRWCAHLALAGAWDNHSLPGWPLLSLLWPNASNDYSEFRADSSRAVWRCSVARSAGDRRHAGQLSFSWRTCCLQWRLALMLIAPESWRSACRTRWQRQRYGGRLC